MPAPTLIKKQFTSKATVSDDERTITAVISTGAVDRDQEVLLAKGADFESYLKNPVVLWAHSYSDTPIAKTLWIKKGRNQITAKLKFATKEQSPMAEEVYQLFKGGFLNAFSVGFIATERHKPMPDEIKKNPELANAFSIIDKWELLEFSVVPVPANPEALATAIKSKSIELSDERKKDFADSMEADDWDGETFFIPDVEVKEPEPIEVKLVKTDVSMIVDGVKVLPEKINVKSHIDYDIIVDREIKRRKGIMYV